MAVKVTELPEHIVVEEADILTLACKTGFTTITTLFEVAGFPVAQGEIFEVSTHVTTSPLDSDEVVNMELLVPLLIPFTFH